MSTKRSLPKSIVVGPKQKMPVVEASLREGMGYFSPKLFRIVINSNQPHAGKHWTLLHELIHVASEKLKQGKIVKRQPSEEYVTNLAGALFPMLVYSGLWKGLTRKELDEFFKLQK
jgi:Zn-dependent peptidase ImmA (M78 family)